VKYILIILFIIVLQSCTSYVSNNNDIGLKIDIYNKEMTYEKFKQAAINYAQKASFPKLTNK
tara:strand:+ start:587 stop:772 length:186 start_codon:yes stop_codon:yes gene_type:complete